MLRATVGFILLLGAWTLTPGCTQTIEYSQRLRIPLSGDPATARAQSMCISACDPLSRQDLSRYAACLSACPYAERLADGPCDRSEPANQAYCVDFIRKRTVSDPESTENALNAVGAMLELMAEVSDVADDCHHSRSYSSHRGHPQHHKKNPRRNSAPQKIAVRELLF